MTASETGDTFPELFERAVARWPGATAVVPHDGEPLTYSQLASRARQLARRLIADGIGPEDIVAVVADRRSSDWLTGLLAVLLGGGAYLPLDPEHPPERVSFMLADAAPKLILGRVPPDWEPAGRAVLDPAAARVDGVGDQPVAPAERTSALGPDNLAYVIYTSGTSGRPKGVAVTHRGFAALGATQARAIGSGPADQVLQWASPSFDAAFWDLTLALLHGATLHLAPPEELLPGDPLAGTLTGRGITHATLPPVALGALDAGSGLLRGATVVSTGDTCTQGLVDRWAPDRTLINGYGPTETTVGATLTGPLTAGRPAHIGTPFQRTRVDVVNDALEPLPPDTTGQLAVAGPGVARGYLARPRLTAQCFRPDPRGGRGRRMYLTGDHGRQSPDGRFHFGGREDDQVKVRGFRIELGEIESALVRHPDVAAAAVAVRQQADGEDAVVAWVMPGTADAALLRKHLAERLPAHMLPRAIVVLDELPVNAHGKIDRPSLALPEHTADDGRDPVAAPEPGGLEADLCQVFAETLDTAGVGPDDDFFDLGGDSIQYTRIIGRVNRDREIRLPLREAFAGASPRGLARLVRQTAEPVSDG